MKNKLIILLLSCFFSFLIVGCTSGGDEFTKENLQVEMEKRGHEYKNIDNEFNDNLLGVDSEYVVLSDNITVDDKQYIFYDYAFYVYPYENKAEMEKGAALVNEDASIVKMGEGELEKDVEMEWHVPPHFYKKGNIIVRYEGNDEKILNDLENIMGEQFAGE